MQLQCNHMCVRQRERSSVTRRRAPLVRRCCQRSSDNLRTSGERRVNDGRSGGKRCVNPQPLPSPRRRHGLGDSDGLRTGRLSNRSSKNTHGCGI